MAITLNGTTGITAPKLDALDLELGSRNVVESGSNANGEYVRFADGTQICWGVSNVASIDVTSGSGFISPTADYTLPAAMVGSYRYMVNSASFGGLSDLRRRVARQQQQRCG